MAEPRFKLGDRVIVTWRRDNALTMRTGTVTRVFKSGNFRVNDRDVQFRQSGEPTGARRRSGLLVEPATPEALARLDDSQHRAAAVRLLREAEHRVLDREYVRSDLDHLGNALERFLKPETAGELAAEGAASDDLSKAAVAALLAGTLDRGRNLFFAETERENGVVCGAIDSDEVAELRTFMAGLMERRLAALAARSASTEAVP